MVKSIQAVLILIFFSFSVSAHEFNPAHLVIKEVETNIYQTEWMYPAKNIGARGEVLFPQDCIRENTQFEKNGSDFAGIPVSSISAKANVASIFAVDDAEK